MMNGHQHIDPMALFHLGELKNETQRQTEIILALGERMETLQRDILESLQQLPGHIASTLPSARKPFLDSKTVIAILQVLPPLLFLAALIAAKASGALSWAEIIPLMNRAAGG